MALFPMLVRRPDRVLERGSKLSATDLAELRRAFVIVRRRATHVHVDEHGGAYFAVPVAPIIAPVLQCSLPRMVP